MIDTEKGGQSARPSATLILTPQCATNSKSERSYDCILSTRQQRQEQARFQEPDGILHVQRIVINDLW